MTVCVFAASSSRIDPVYVEAASRLGHLLASENMDVIYGGGGIGLMGVLADAVISAKGKVTGVIPGFMYEEGWGHQGITEMIITSDMGERKKKMIGDADAIVALPGGVGTLEKLTEAITLKQLGFFKGPVVILNTLGFYSNLLLFLEDMIKGSFLRREHGSIWSVVNTPGEVITAIKDYKGWLDDPRKYAKIY